MAIFDKEDIKSTGTGTVIGSNVKLIGAIKDANDVVVHGIIEGEVGSDKSVNIGEAAQVKGPVTGAVVTIAGIVRGSVEARERLEILATGKIFGDIVCKELIIRSGALFSGKSTMPDSTDLSTKRAKANDGSYADLIQEPNENNKVNPAFNDQIDSKQNSIKAELEN